MIDPKRKLNICIDIDGTMTDPYYFMPYFNDFFNQELTKEQCTVIKLEELYQIDRKSLEEFYFQTGEEMHRNATILPDVKEVVDLLIEKNNVYIVTARFKEMEHITKSWLQEHDIKSTQLFSLGSHYKVNKAKELNCDFFIEDNPQIAEELADNGFKVLLMNTNYNTYYTHANVQRVYNWRDIEARIQNAMAERVE